MDLVIEFQTFTDIAPLIASKYHDAGIPMIAVEIPHPGATYYGADNYRAGHIGGRYLGKWAKKHWGGRVDEVVVLEQSAAGSLPHSRLTGTLDGIVEVLPHVAHARGRPHRRARPVPRQPDRRPQTHQEQLVTSHADWCGQRSECDRRRAGVRRSRPR